MAPVAASMRIGGMMDVDTRAPVEGSCRPNGRKDRWQGGRQAFSDGGLCNAGAWCVRGTVAQCGRNGGYAGTVGALGDAPLLGRVPARKADDMSTVLTSRAPLRVASRWRAEIVATDRQWQLSVTYFGGGRQDLPRYHACDRRKCLELIVAVKRAWRKIRFARSMRKSARGTILKGVYDVSSSLVEIRPGLLSDYICVFGVRLRMARDVHAFRRGMIASVKLGQKFQEELRNNRKSLG
jgi:hypothetical protein